MHQLYFLSTFSPVSPCVQITEVQVQVTQSTEALKEATTVMTETRRRHQGLDIELQSALSLVRIFCVTLVTYL